jgi:hypothetical protein
MTALPTNSPVPAMLGGHGSWWQAPLYMLGGGLAAASSPGGFANFGAGVTQAGRDWRSMQMERERMGWLRDQAAREQQEFEAEQRRANLEAEQRAAVGRQIAAMFGGAGSVNTASGEQPGQPAMFNPVRPVGNYGAAVGGAPQPAMFGPPRKPAPGVPVDAHVGADGIPGTADDNEPMNAGGDLPFGFNQDQAALFMALPLEQQIEILTERGFAEPERASSGVGKIMEDFNRGLIDAPTRDALLKKETYIAPPAGQGLTERQRNAIAAGLIPGTPGYQQYILGRDDNEGGGPFEGNAMDAQASNILLTGNPASPEYAAAYAHLAQPKVQFDPTTNRLVTVSPDLSWATPPQRGQGASMPGALPIMPSVGGNRPGPTMQNAQALPQPSAPAAPGTETMQVPGATITSSPGTGLSAGDRTKLRTVKAEAQSIRDALTRFRDVVKSSNWLDDISAAAGGTTEGGRRLNSAWTNAAIMTKAEALFNLGVLNGPDLSVIQGTLPNPATMSGLFTSEEAAAAAVDEVLRLIDSKVAAFEAQFGGSVAPTVPSPTLPGGGTRVDSLPAGNWQ